MVGRQPVRLRELWRRQSDSHMAILFPGFLSVFGRRSVRRRRSVQLQEIRTDCGEGSDTNGHTVNAMKSHSSEVKTERAANKFCSPFSNISNPSSHDRNPAFRRFPPYLSAD